MNQIVSKIEKVLPDSVVSHNETFGELSVVITRDRIFEVCRYLHDEPGLDFDFITDICSNDYPNEYPRFEMIYHFYSIKLNHRIRLKVRVPEEDCHVDSVVAIWQGANFMEREVYDMMGIRFNNHPDLRRILMSDDYEEGYPLRKDFPVEGRGWRDQFESLETE